MWREIYSPSTLLNVVLWSDAGVFLYFFTVYLTKRRNFSELSERTFGSGEEKASEFGRPSAIAHSELRVQRRSFKKKEKVRRSGWMLDIWSILFPLQRIDEAVGNPPEDASSGLLGDLEVILSESEFINGDGGENKTIIDPVGSIAPGDPSM